MIVYGRPIPQRANVTNPSLVGEVMLELFSVKRPSFRWALAVIAVAAGYC